MKNTAINKTAAALAMAAALLSCSKNEPTTAPGEEEKPLPSEITLSFTSPAGLEKLGVFILGEKPTVNAQAKLSGGESKYTAGVKTFAEGDALLVYAPYAGDAASLETIPFEIPEQQSVPKAGERNPEIGLYLSGAVKLPAPAEEVELAAPVTLTEHTPTAVFVISDPSGAHASETLQSISFTSSGDAISGRFLCDLSAETPEFKAEAGSKSVTVIPDIVSAIGSEESRYTAVAAPGKYAGKLEVETSAARFTFNEIAVETGTMTKVDLSAADLVEIISEAGWKAFANSVDAGDWSAWKNSDGEVKLGADLETTTYLQRVGAVKEPHDWDGVFNGQNHTITQHETSVPLFTVIGMDGVVENLVLEGELKKASYPSGPSTAAVAQYNRGTIRNVVNAIEINLTDVDEPYMIGGMVIMNGGLIENCVQKGDINVGYNLTAIRVSYIGGIACFAADAAEYAKEGVEVNVGTFRGCTNSGKITVNKAGAAKAYLNKFAVGGICAIVQNGTPAAYPLFEGCRNEGDIVRRDDSNGLNSCSAMGGIVGRAANYYQLKTGGAFDVDNYQVYLKISDCHNTGNIECSAFLTNGWASGSSTTGARMGATGGIIGYANGFDESPALITGCTSKCTVSGGHDNQTVVMGGIAGMTSRTEISNCSAETVFSDSSLSLDELKVATVGGVIGYVRHNSSVTGGQYSAEIAMPKTVVADAGMLAGGCYIGKTPQTLSASGVKLCGSISHKGLETPVTVTSENISANLVSFGTCASENVSLWVK